MRRVTEVLDCWFESRLDAVRAGALPVREREWFEQHFPGDFIVEGLGPDPRLVLHLARPRDGAVRQARLHEPASSHGIVLGNDGQKASKSLRNYPDPFEMFDTYGSDAVRWFLMSSAILRGTDLSVTEQGIRDAARQVILPLWNSWYFFTLYANAGGLPPKPWARRRHRRRTSSIATCSPSSTT